MFELAILSKPSSPWCPISEGFGLLNARQFNHRSDIEFIEFSNYLLRMQKRGKVLSLWVILFFLVSLTACSSNSENKELAKKACSALSAADKKEVIGGSYADPSLKTDYLKAKVLFNQLSDNESGSKDDLDIFKAYADSIERWANGVRRDRSGMSQVKYFCGPDYVKSSIRYFPDQVWAENIKIEEYLGVEVPQTSSENRESSYEVMGSLIIAIILIIIYLFAVYWIGLTAKRAGRSFLGWFLLGMVIPPIAGIIVLTFKPENKVMDSLKKCPFCAESIQLEAKFCRFCSKEISFT